jgi:GNAT superfamily N-acetyltransferase
VQVLGYVSLSAGQVETQRLPAHLKLLRYPAPVLRMGRLGVDLRSQGAGVGRQLMSFALQLALEFSQAVGIYAVLVDAKNEQVQGYYQSLGFMPTRDDPLCLFLPAATLQKARAQATVGG